MTDRRTDEGMEDGTVIGSPSLILVLSGKRKSGKDFLADILQKRFSDACVIIRLSGPLKEQYAKENGLDYQQLLDASEYKEKYREDMILWGEEKRKKDPGFFCRHAVIQSKAEHKPIWVVSDARRATDLDFFFKTYPGVTKTVRISSSLETRTRRGWIFVAGVDDAESECGLDAFTSWNFVVVNNGSAEELEKEILPIVELMKRSLP